MKKAIEITGMIIGVACLLGFVAILVAECFRCPRCRRWHECKEDEANCDGKI